MLRLANLQFQKSVKRAVGNMQTDFESMMKNQEVNDQMHKGMLLQLGVKVQVLLDRSIHNPRLEGFQPPERALPPSAEMRPLNESSLNTGIAPVEVSTPPFSAEGENHHPSTHFEPITEESDENFWREDALRYLKPIAETYGRDIQAMVAITSKAT
ncbi:MAG: hypothetical protein M1820_001451 [Bogoriella megaspora]|nr:MAG: hypothetical protein M1820_001451 [Bogoriella megaspora]